jgi:hypothetical protein
MSLHATHTLLGRNKLQYIGGNIDAAAHGQASPSGTLLLSIRCQVARATLHLRPFALTMFEIRMNLLVTHQPTRQRKNEGEKACRQQISDT